MTNSIVLRSDVARDLEQSAGLFKTDKLVVWEYVANSLQYVDPGVMPVVKVLIDAKRKRVVVEDNGRGMDATDLQNFFIMHGENQDRKQGRIGRGYFGTGKSAAFGIGDILRITTVKNKKRSCVELRREDLRNVAPTAPVPIRTLESELSTREPNGTTVEIERVHLRSFDQAGIVKYIERNLAHARRDATVIVNNHECEYVEPPVSEVVQATAYGEYAALLGSVDLTIKIAKAVLDPDLRGISIYANGVLHETTLGASEGKDMSQYLFGDIDVPALDLDASPIRPYDMSRAMVLNPSNELVQCIYAFISENTEKVRKRLLEAEKRRRESEESRQLSEQASKIAELLNEDFQQFRDKFARVRAKGRGAHDVTAAESLAKGSAFLFPDGDDPAISTDITVELSGDGRKPTPPGPDRPSVPTTQLLGPSANGSDRGGKPTDIKRNRDSYAAGFSVDFKNHGDLSPRAKYSPEDRTIYINLDHPQIAAARQFSDEPSFKRLAYEVAFAEYAIALAQELANEGQYADLTDPIVDIRETINRLARRAATLYTRL